MIYLAGNMSKYILLYIFLLLFIPSFAQELKTVSAEYIYYAPETMPIIEAKKNALERAKIKAIEEEFGSIVSQTNTTALSNINGESDTRFFSLGGSDVKGEWIETIGEPQYGDIFYKDNMLVVPCRVKGKVREMQYSAIDFVAKPLRNGIEQRFESYQFKEGDDLFLYFKSPVDGFLSVFLVDETSEIVYCALPYRNSDGNPKQIKADKEYILFSAKNCDNEEKSIVDEYVMTASNDLEYNDFYILFSTEPFSKAVLQSQEDTSLPKTLNWHDFQKWLAKARIKNSKLSLSKIILTISKK